MSFVISAARAYLIIWFQSRHAMQLEILALRHQLAVYQNGVKRPPLQPADRFFWVWLARLWSGWQHTLEFVQPRTVLAWQKQRFRDYWRRLSQSGKPGRPVISKEVRDLIRDMWRSNPTWGSPRIVDELRKLDITVAKSTVEKYRPRVRKPPSPTWRAFLANHVKDIVACDFFTVPTDAPARASHARVQVSRSRSAIPVGIWSNLSTFSPTMALAVSRRVSRKDEKLVRQLGGDDGHKASGLSAGSVGLKP
jgi:hypothetical protein